MKQMAKREDSPVNNRGKTGEPRGIAEHCF